MKRALRLVASVATNRAGGVPRPSWCTYLVTYRCNARCGMCDSWRMKPGAELDEADVVRIFEGLGGLDVVRVSGGEPFLRDDLASIVDAIRRAARPLVLHITTNGSLPDAVDDLASSFAEPRRLSVMVSLDGHRAEHDANRGDRVTYDTAFETLRRLVALRARRGIDVSANYTVISPRSLADADTVRAELAAMGVDMHVVLAYAGSATYGIKLRGKRAEHLIVPDGYPLHPALEGADVAALIERELVATEALASRTRRMGKRYYLRGLLARLRNESPALPNPPCVELRSHLRVLPDGSVPVCQYNGEVVGNLRTQSLADVWRAPKTVAARSWVDRCAGCWAECEVIPNAIYTGDLLAHELRRDPARP